MKKLNHKRLAEGDATGHYHEAVAKSSALYETGEQDMVLKAPRGTKVKHQEHKPLRLPPGDYDRLIVLEFDPFENEIREVID